MDVRNGRRSGGLGVLAGLLLAVDGLAAEPHDAAQGVDAAQGADVARSADAAPSADAVQEDTSGAEQARTVVTATRLPRPQRDVPATVVVLPRQEVDRSPTLTTDTLLRTVPSAATFRRSSSLVADPSSQGLNLRGVGPSGVSRGLVLLDGVPVNDAFGGWVPWRSLPRLGLGRIEVVPGGGSALYGSAALGGVVQLFSRPLTEGLLEADASLGQYRTGLLGALASRRWGAVGAGVEAEWLSSAGHPVVSPAQRGPIDGDAPSSHLTLDGRVEVDATERLRLTARAGLFREEQSGGTAYTTARAEAARTSLGASLRTEDAGSFDLTLFGRLQRFGQQRARVAEGRVSEALAAEQEVPASEAGLSLLWTGAPVALGGTHTLSAGVDVRRVEGASHERLSPPVVRPTSTVEREAGGRQLFGGVFVQDDWAVSPALTLNGALRLDGWRNSGGARRLERGDGSVEREAFAPRGHAQLSPRLGMLVRPVDWLGVRASGWRAFRAPTLNELYRPFQVGTVLTAANEALGPESLWGAEAGVEATAPFGLTARLTGFWNLLDAPITNVTLPAPLPDGSSRQRQNLGAARVQGVEVGADWRLARAWTALVAYTLVDARVLEAPSQPELVGRRLAQDPVHRATALLTFDEPRLLTATVQLRVVGPQFEDDLNTLRLPGYAVVDASVSRHLFWNVHAFAAVENLFDREYLVGRAGVDTVGQPFLARVGLRLREPPARPSPSPPGRGKG